MKPSRNPFLRTLATTAVSVALTALSNATTYYWDTNGAAGFGAVGPFNWATANNFWNTDSTGATTGTFVALPTSADDLNISAGTTGTITISTTGTAGSLTISDPVAITITGGTLALGGTTTNKGLFVTSAQTAATTISSAVTLNSAATTIQNAGTGLLTISGGITGAQNLILNNNGATASGVTISTASLNNTGTVTNSGSGAGSVLISGGVGSNVTGINQNSTTSALNITTTALTVNSGGTTLTNTAGTQLLTVSGGITGTGNLILNNNSATASGITLSTTAVNNTGTVTNSGSSTGTVLISSVIGTNVTGVVQNSSTSNLTLSGVNTFTSGLTIKSGTVNIQTSANSLGGNANTLFLGDTAGTAAATLNYSNGGGSLSFAQAINVVSGSSGTLTIQTSSGQPTFNGAVTLNNNLTLSNTNSATTGMIFAGGFTGTGNLSLASNSKGSITLQTGAVNNSGTITSNFTAGANGTATISAAIGSNVTTVTQNGTSTFALSGGITVGASNKVFTSSNTGAYNITGGVTGTGNITFNNSSSGTITVSTADLNNTGTITSSISSTGGVTISSNIGSNVTGVTQNSTSGTPLILSGTNTYTGPTTLTGGWVSVGASANLGAAGANLVFNGGGLLITGTTLTNFSGIGHTVSFTAGKGVFLNINAGANTFTVDQALTQTTGGFQKQGAGTVILNQTNTYTGATTVIAGTLTLGAAGALGDGTNNTSSVTVSSGAVLDLNGITPTASNVGLTLNGTGITNGALVNSSATPATYGGLLTLGSASSIVASSGNIILSNAGTISGAGLGLTLDGTATGSSIAGIIGTTTGTVTKNGTGTWTLSGVNTYTGTTTVSAGELDLTGNRTAAAGNFAVGGTGGAILGISNGNFAIGANQIAIGIASGSSGTVNQTGGTINTGTGNQLLVGNAGGTGTYNLSAGTLNTATGGTGNRGVMIGVNSNSTGTFNLSGTGTLNVVSGTLLEIGRSDSAASTTTNLFSQTAGTATIGGTLSIGGSGTTSTNVTSTMTLTGGTFSATSFSKLANGNNDIVAINIGGTAQVTLPAFPFARGAGATANITFDSSTGFLSPGAASTTYMQAGTFDNAYLTANGAKFNVGSGNDITIGQAFKDSTSPAAAGILTKSGAGTLTLSGTNTYTGGTTVSAGMLQFAKTASLPSTGTWAATGTSTMAVNAGGSGEFTNATSGAGSIGGFYTGGSFASGTAFGIDTTNAGGTLSYAGNFTTAGVGITKLGTGTLTLSGNNTYTGATTVLVGTLKAGSTTALSSGSALTVTSPGILDLGGFSNTVGSMAASTGTLTDSSAAGSGGKLTVTATTGGLAAQLTGSLAVGYWNSNSGSATTSFFSTNTTNTYSGGTTLGIGLGSSGRARLVAAASETIGNAPGAGLTSGKFGTGPIYIGLNSSDQGQIYINATNVTINNPIVYNSSVGTDIQGSIRLDSTGLTLAGTQTATSGSVILIRTNTSATGSATITGQITGPNQFQIASAGTAQTVTLNNTINSANDYTGDTFVFSSLSTLKLGAANQIPNGTGKGNLNLNTNGKFDMNGFSETINGLTSTTTAVIDGQAAGTPGTNTLTIGDGNATGNTYTGSIINTVGTLSVVKIGSGSQTLSTGTSTFSGGLTIKNGSIIALNSTVLGGTGGNTGAVTLGDTTGSNPASLLIGSNSTTISNPVTLATNASVGTLSLGISTGALSSAFSGGVTGTNNLTLANGGSGTLTFQTAAINNVGTVTNAGSGSGSTSIAFALGSNVTDVIQNSTTSTLSIASGVSNNYTGSTYIKAGTLQLNGAGGGTAITPLSSGTVYLGDTTGTNAATLNFGNTNILANPIIVQSNSNASTKAINVNTSGTPVYSGGITLNDNLDITTGSTTGLTIQTGNVTINNSSTLSFKPSGTNAGTFTVSSNITGTGGNVSFGGTTSGSPVFILTGANNYTGTTTVSKGTLRIGNTTATGSLSPSSAITDNAAIQFFRTNATVQGTDFANNITGTGTVTVSGGGTYTFTSNSFQGGLTLSGATTTTLNINHANALGTGTFTISGGNNAAIDNTSGGLITLNNNAQTWTNDFAFWGSNSLNMGTGAVSMGGTRTLNVTGSTLTVGGVISGTGFGITKNGGGTLVLSGANLYTGTTTVNAGFLQAGGTTAFGPAANASLAFGGSSTGTIQLKGNSMTVTGLNTNATVGTPVLENASASAATLTVTAASTFGLGGVIRDGTGGGALALINGGSTTLTLSSNNSFSGGLTNSGTGVISLAHSNAAGTGPINLQVTSTGTGSNLTLSGGITVANTVNINDAVGRNNIGTTGTASNTLSGNIAISGTGNIIIIQNNATGTTTFTVGGATPNSTTITGATMASNISFRGSGTSGTINSQFNTPNATFDINGAANWTINSTGNNWGAVTGIISTGNLILGATNALDTASRLDHSGAGDLDLNGFNQSLAGLNQATTVSGALITNNSSSADSTLTLSGLASNLTYANVIADGASKKVSLVMNNSTAFTQTLSGVNTFSGSTTVSNGTLIFNNNLAIQNSALVTTGAGAVNLGAGITTPTFGGLSGATGDLATVISSGYGSVTALTLNPGTGSTVTYGGAIADGASGMTLAKTGAGTQILTGVNTYSGATTVQGGGTLQLTGTGSINPTTGAALTLGGGGSAGTFQYDSSATSKFDSINVGSGSGNAGTLNQTNGTINATSLTLSSVFSSGNGNVTIGNASGNTAVMNVSGNASVSAASSGALSTLTVNATGTLAVTGTLGLATSTTRDANGTITQNGGSVSAASLSLSGNVSDASSRTHTSVYNLNGGSLSVGSITTGSVTTTGTISNTFNFNGGTLTATASNASFWASSADTTANVQQGGALINTNGFDITIAQPLLHAGTGTNDSLSKSGAGTLTLSGANSYTGTTTVSNGMLEVTANNALGTNAAGTSVSSGAALKLTGVNYSTAEALSINGTGISGGGALVNSGTSTFGGQVTAATDATINSGGGSLTFTGGIDKTGTVLTLTGGGTIYINSAITGNTGSPNSDLVVDATTVNLNTANSYNGPTYIKNAGTINATVSNALPTANGATAIHIDETGSGGSTLSISADQTIASLSGGTVSPATTTVAIDNKHLTVGDASNTTYAGTFTGGGSGELIKQGSGTLTLSGDSDVTNFNAIVRITDGAISINQVEALGKRGTARTLYMTNGGTLQTTATMSFNTRIFDLGTGGGQFDVNSGTDLTVKGAIQGAGNLTKKGDGTMILDAAGTYGSLTGNTNVTGGKLIVNGNISTSLLTTVSSGATLAGTGTVGATMIQGGATLEPGVSGVGTLTVNSTTLGLNDTTILNFNFNPLDTTAGGGINDLVTGITDLTLDGQLNVSATSGDFLSATNGTAWRLFNYTGVLSNNAISFGSMPSLGAGLNWSIDTSIANQVNLVVVPEPDVATLIGGIGMLFLLRRRR